MRMIEEHADLELILLDLTLPDRDGFSLLAELRERCPAVSVVVLSALDDRGNVIKALDLGALGFIPKNAAEREVMLERAAVGVFRRHLHSARNSRARATRSYAAHAAGRPASRLRRPISV